MGGGNRWHASLVSSRNVFPWDSSRNHTCTFSLLWELSTCKKTISHVVHQGPGKNDSAWPSNLLISTKKPFLPQWAHINTHTKGLFWLVSVGFPVLQCFWPKKKEKKNKLLCVLRRKGQCRKSLWESIRQFSVRSAADTQVIYSEGAGASASRIGSGGERMLVDILPCSPNLSPDTLIMTNNLCNVVKQPGYTPPQSVLFIPSFQSRVHFHWPQWFQLKRRHFERWLDVWYVGVVSKRPTPCQGLTTWSSINKSFHLFSMQNTSVTTTNITCWHLIKVQSFAVFSSIRGNYCLSLRD